MESLHSHKIIPDVIDKVSSHTIPLIVTFGNEEVQHGITLSWESVQKEPKVSWTPTNGKYYTLVMTDPDAPSRHDHKFREWRHWIVGNISGGNNEAGKVVESFMPSGPPHGSGLHRYVFLLYEHSQPISSYKIKDHSNRAKWKVHEFAEEHALGIPIAVNFYQCERK